MSPRPKSDNSMDRRVEIRLDNETLEKLDILVEQENTDRSKLIREEILKKYAEELKKK